MSGIAANGAPPESIQPYRGWSDADWRAATERLRSRGWLDEDGAPTVEGDIGRDALEAETDRLAQEPLDRLGPVRAERLIRLLEDVGDPVITSGTVPYPNAMGAPRPNSDD